MQQSSEILVTRLFELFLDLFLDTVQYSVIHKKRPFWARAGSGAGARRGGQVFCGVDARQTSKTTINQLDYLIRLTHQHV